jgi:hypothetical protein
MKKLVGCLVALSLGVPALACSPGYVQRCFRGACYCYAGPCVTPWGTVVQSGAKFWGYSQATADYLQGQNCDQYFVLETCQAETWTPGWNGVYTSCSETDVPPPPPPPSDD